MIEPKQISEEGMAEIVEGLRKAKELIGKPDMESAYDVLFAHIAWQDQRTLRILEYLGKIDAWYHLQEAVDDGKIRGTTFDEMLEVRNREKKTLDKLRNKLKTSGLEGSGVG